METGVTPGVCGISWVIPKNAISHKDVQICNVKWLVQTSISRSMESGIYSPLQGGFREYGGWWGALWEVLCILGPWA